MSRTLSTLWRFIDLNLNTILGFIKGFLIIPLYINFIKPELLGAWFASGNILIWLTVIDPGVGDVALQRISIAASKNDKNLIGLQITSSIILSAVFCLFVIILGLTLSGLFLKKFININNIVFYELQNAFNVAIITTGITILSFSLSGSLLGLQGTKVLALGRNIMNIVGLAINIALLFLNFKLMAIAYSGLFTASGLIIFYTFVLINEKKAKKFKLIFNYKFTIQNSRIFSYTFFSKLFSTVAQNVDLIIISKLLGNDTVTNIEICRKPLILVGNFLKSISISFLPGLSHLFGEGNMEKLKKIIRDFTENIFLLSFIVAGLYLAFIKNFIKLWIGYNHFIGIELVAIIAIGFFISNICYGLYNFAFSTGNIKESSNLEIFKNTFYILLLFGLGLNFGIIGILVVPILIGLFIELPFYFRLFKKKMNLNLFDNIYTRNNLFIISIILLNFLIVHKFLIESSWIIFIGLFVISSIVIGTITLKLNESIKFYSVNILEKIIKN